MRRRVLAFIAVFLIAGVGGGLLVYHVSDTQVDPRPIVYLFPVIFAILLGTFPTLAYFLDRWIKQFKVTHCPICGAFIWSSTASVVQMAVLPRCPRCWKPLAAESSTLPPFNDVAGTRRLDMPAGAQMFLGAPAHPLPEYTSKAIARVVATVDGVTEAHLPQCFAASVMETSAQILVVVLAADYDANSVLS